MLKIRLMRIGTKQRPFYRVVAVDERNKRTGGYIENLGTYNPLTEPKEIKLKQDRIDYWTKQGAQMSVGFLRIIGKAPKRAPRKPKKESKQATGTSEQVKQPEVQKNSDKPENQNIGEPEKPDIPVSDPSGQSDTPSPSESSEKNIEEPKTEAKE